MTGSVHMPRLRTVGALGLALAGVLLLVAPPSRATFRGANGLLLYQSQVGANTQVFTIKPDGTGATQITHFKDSSATDATWAPGGGGRVVFDRHWHPEGGPNERLVIYTAKFDGTGLRALSKAGNAAIGPNWLPDGRR